MPPAIQVSMNTAMPSWNQRGAAVRGAVRYWYRIVSGCSAIAFTLPANSLRKIRSRAAVWSSVATCTSSWFMIVFIRSLAAIVSNAKLSGEICTIMKLRGRTETPALP